MFQQLGRKFLNVQGVLSSSEKKVNWGMIAFYITIPLALIIFPSKNEYQFQYLLLISMILVPFVQAIMSIIPSYNNPKVIMWQNYVSTSSIFIKPFLLILTSSCYICEPLLCLLINIAVTFQSVISFGESKASLYYIAGFKLVTISLFFFFGRENFIMADFYLGVFIFCVFYPVVISTYLNNKHIESNEQIQANEEQVIEKKDCSCDKEMYKQFFKSFPHPAFIIDLNVNIQSAAPHRLNPQAEQLLECCDNLFEISKLIVSNCTLTELINSTRRKVTQYFLHRDSIKVETRSLYSSLLPIVNEKTYDIIASTFESSKDIRMMGLIMIESPKDIEQEKQVLETFKSSLICTLSHELCNPMNSLIPLIKQMPSYYDEEMKEDIKDDALASAELLLCKIRDLIDYTKIELKQFKADEDEFKVCDVFDDLRKIFKYEVLHKGNSLYFEIKTTNGKKLVILADKLRIKQVLAKLICNANKFTTNGEIKVTASENKDNLDVCFSVSDNGVGIDKEKLKLIFSSLYEKAKLANVPYEGSTKLPGLGLLIATSICKCLGSKLKAKSVEGKGSTFYFDVPICRIYTTPNNPRLQSSTSKEIKKLKDSDRAYSSRVLIDQKTKCGSPDRENAGIDRIQKLKNLFHLASNGKSKRLSTFAPKTPHTSSQEVNDCQEIKYSIVKEKYGFIERAISDPNCDLKMKNNKINLREPFRICEEKKVIPEAKEKSLRERKINSGVVLITDDVCINRMVLRNMLMKMNIHTIEAGNGEEAVKQVANSINEGSRQVIQLILMDLCMPVMDGIKATIEIRKLEKENKRIYKIPIVDSIY